MGQNCLSRPTLKLIRCKAKPGCSPRRYTPRRLLVIVNWSPTFSAALALLVVSRRTRTQCCGFKKQKFADRGVPRQVVGVLVCSTKLVDGRGRSRVLHLRRSCVRVVAECTVFITHWSMWRNRSCGLNVHGIHRMRVTGIFNASWLSPPSCG